MRRPRQENPHVRFLHVRRLGSPAGLELDLVYRPYQLSNLLELDLLRRLSDRVVLNQLDVIAFDNPAYFPSRCRMARLPRSDTARDDDS